MLLKETFSNSIAFTLINKYAKDAVIQISTVCWHVSRAVFQGVLRNETF